MIAADYELCEILHSDIYISIKFVGSTLSSIKMLKIVFLLYVISLFVSVTCPIPNL